MRIGIRAHDVAYAPINELIPNIHKQGFHCMHIALGKSIKEFNTGVEAMTPGLAMYMKELCQENKVDVAVLGCYLNLCNPNPVKHAEIVEKYKAHIRFASILGCGVVGTETGAVNEEYKYEEANHSEEALECFIKNLRPIVKYAENLVLSLPLSQFGNTSFIQLRELEKCLMPLILQTYRLFLTQLTYFIQVILRIRMKL